MLRPLLLLALLAFLVPSLDLAASESWSGDEFECTDEENRPNFNALGHTVHRFRIDCWGRSQYEYYFEQTIEIWRFEQNGEWLMDIERQSLYILYDEGHSTHDRFWRVYDRGTFGKAHVSYLESRPGGDGCHSRVHYFTEGRDPAQELRHGLPGCITEPRTLMPRGDMLP